jgi:hypothetical protein
LSYWDDLAKSTGKAKKEKIGEKKSKKKTNLMADFEGKMHTFVELQ